MLPVPGTMVHLSPAFNPPVLKGIKIHVDDPLKFDFILDKGEGIFVFAPPIPCGVTQEKMDEPLFSKD